jgi:ParB/RepB/Spo0J family partition protein
MSSEYRVIKITNIMEPEGDLALRKVDRESEGYQDLRESVREEGILKTLLVRELEEEGKYGLVDGLQRFNAAKDVGLEEVPCHIKDIDEARQIEFSLIANVHTIETKPVEYSRAIVHILTQNPLLTRAELSGTLHKTETWLSERLGLLKLTDEIGQLVDSGRLKLSNAYQLAKLTPEEQADFLDRALTMPPQQFTPTIAARIKEIRDAKRKGRDAGPAEFQAVAILRSKAELLIELSHKENIVRLCNGKNSAEEGYLSCLKWVLNLDEDSIQDQREKDEERKAERERQKEKAKLERTRKKAKEAAEKAEELKKELETSEA